MNKQIEKFIDDTKLTAVSEMFEDELINFAELIIEECIQFIEEENIRLCNYQNSIPEWDVNKRSDCDLVIEKCIDLAERLKEHFGIEK